MSKELVEELITKFEQFSEKEQELISKGLKNNFGKHLSFSTDKLSQVDEKDLLIIKSIIDGMILTLQNVPNIIAEHERLKDLDLPSRVTFGQIHKFEE